MAATAVLPGGSDGRERSRSPRRESFSRDDQFNSWNLVSKGTNSYGGVLNSLYAPNGQEPQKVFCHIDPADSDADTEKQRNARVCLSIDEEKWKIRPNFLTDPKSTKKESFPLLVSIEDDEMLTYLDALDSWAMSKCITDQKTLLGPKSNLPAEQIKVLYAPCVKRDVDGKYPPSLKLKVNVTGNEHYLTEMKIYHPDGSVHMGTGWTFLKQHMGDHKLHHYRVGMHLAIRSFSVLPRGAGFGLSIEAKKLVFFSTPAMEAERSAQGSPTGGKPYYFENLMTHLVNGSDTSPKNTEAAAEIPSDIVNVGLGQETK